MQPANILNEQPAREPMKLVRSLPDRYPEPPADFSSLTAEQKQKRIDQIRKYLQYRMLHQTTKPIYPFPEDLELMINDYFEHPKKGKITFKNKEVEITYLTISGLMLHVGIVDNATFFDYGKREGYSEIIKTARKKIVDHYESLLQSGASPAGSIFALKNIDNWTDRMTQDINQTVKEIKVNVDIDETAKNINEL